MAPAEPAASGRLTRWRQVWPALVITAVVIAGGIVIALLRPTAQDGYLDPASTLPDGTHALADILAERGTQVVRVTTATAAAAGRGASTIVVTSPGLLTGSQLTALARTPASILLIAPDRAALTALAPAVTISASVSPRLLQPRCRLTAARLAGTADMGGTGLRLQPGLPGASCYPAGPAASLVQYSAGSRQVTVLGSGIALENQHLAAAGNAALMLNLLSHRGQVAWLVPNLQFTATGSGSRPSSLWSLIPLGAYLVSLQLAIAVLCVALWRARRLGRLVPEPLPVVVRAAETTEGHARLYQARRARDQAAAALRGAALERLVPALGLPPAADAQSITAVLAARCGLDAGRLGVLLFGPPPGSDAALVRLADDLDAMEREVRAR
jgi:Domain of unknown function (DUF4350)